MGENHEYVEVRKYAHDLMRAKVDALLEDFSVLVSLLESDWEDTSEEGLEDCSQLIWTVICR